LCRAYGFYRNIHLIKEICENYSVLLIEDVTEAIGATWEGRQCGSFGDYTVISFNGNNLRADFPFESYAQFLFQESQMKSFKNDVE